MNSEYIIRAVIGELSCTLVLPKEVASELQWQKDEDLKCVIRNSELVISKMIKT
jgi:antitoxin component of MazEF toxin-antitoxin module